MSRTIDPGFALFGLLAVASCSSNRQVEAPPPFDVLLVGGTVYNGADTAPVVEDVGILDGRVVKLGDLHGREALLRLDVHGLAVAPGFVDIHSHAVRGERDDGVFRWPDAENEIRQGVTTVIGGPDGYSPLPITDTFEYLQNHPVSVNFGTFVGHSSIRGTVMGNDDRPPSAVELDQMSDLVADAMRNGAFGLSSGLIYPPGRFANTDEVVRLASVAGHYGGIYISHMRDEGLGVLKSVEETIHIGEAGHLPTQITHHKIVSATLWGASKQTLQMVDAARSRGVDVSIDVYPYTASSSDLTILFPGWSMDGGGRALLQRLRDPETRARLKADVIRNLKEDRGGNDPANVAIASCPFGTQFNGKDLSEILRQQARPVTFDEAAELLLELVERGSCKAIFHAISAQDVENIIRHPATMIASDGGVEAPSERMPHPRNYGAFARVLGVYVREMKVLSLQTAIYKMTQMPADRLGITDRGRLAPGVVADVVVFDPAKIVDRATFENPHQYAAGVNHVFVGGVAVLLDGEMTKARPGKILRSGNYRR